MKLEFDGRTRAEWRQNWPVVLGAAAGIGIAGSPAYTIGIMIGPLEQEFGWTRAQISSGPLIPACLAVVIAPFLGMAVDRFGPRRIGVFGVFVLCIMLALLGTATSSLWSWWLLWSALAVGSVTVKPMIWTAGVSSLFGPSRGLALAVALCGTALGSTLTPMVTNALVEHFGWRVAYAGLGLLWAILIIPPVFFLYTSALDRDRLRKSAPAPASHRATSASAARALFSWRYLKLAAASLAMVLTTVAFAFNLVPILVSTGQSRQTAAQLAGLIGVSTIVGRLTGGWLLDRANANLVAALSITVPIVACLLLLFLPGSFPAAVAASLLVGVGLGAELDSVAYLATRHFGVKSFGLLFGTIGGLQSLGTGVSPLIVSYIYDVTHAYTLALWLFIPICLAGALLFLSLGRYPDLEKSEGGAAPGS